MKTTILVLMALLAASTSFAGECKYRAVSQRGLNGCNFIFSDERGAKQSLSGYDVTAETCAQAAAQLINSDLSRTSKVLVDSNGRSVEMESMGMSQMEIDSKIWWGTWRYEEKTTRCHASRATFEYTDGEIKVSGTVQKK